MENYALNTVSLSEIAIVIPSLEPEPGLLQLLRQLRLKCSYDVIVVNDGSRADCDPIFSEAVRLPGVFVLKHEVNMGKGRSLKDAFEVFLKNCPRPVGVVTADADGQHLPEDIIKCAETLRCFPASLILGCRQFSGKEVPWKSRFGNRLTIGAFRLFGGIAVSDTQTGLRGIPASFLPVCLEIPGDRFEYETGMLLATVKVSPPVEIQEVPIATVYEEGNRRTHFHAVRDSLKIYRIILAGLLGQFMCFFCSGLLAAALDQGLFALLFYRVLPMLLPQGKLLTAVIVARIFSLLCNYAVNRKVVFQCRGAVLERRSFVLYLGLCCFVMGESYGLLKLVTVMFPTWPVWLAKLILDTMLFFQNFFIQKKWCFKQTCDGR